MINKIRKVILLITTILFACHLQVAGKELFVSKQSIADFKYIFDKLSQNRIIYNQNLALPNLINLTRDNLTYAILVFVVE